MKSSRPDLQGVGHEFVGRVLAGRMEGTVTAAGINRPWHAIPRAPAE